MLAFNTKGNAIITFSVNLLFSKTLPGSIVLLQVNFNNIQTQSYSTGQMIKPINTEILAYELHHVIITFLWQETCIKEAAKLILVDKGVMHLTYRIYFTAIILISTFTNLGKAETCTVSLAGNSLSKNFP